MSLCSVTVGVLLPVATWLWGLPLSECLLALFVGVIVVFQHRSNIVRLLHGQEKRFEAKWKQ